MRQALKNFGLGLVYFFLLPFFLVLVALVAVFGLGLMAYRDIKGLIRFFRGEKFFEPIPEDVRVQEIKEYRASVAANAPAPQPTQPSTNSNVYIQQNYYQPQTQGQQPLPGQPTQPQQPTSIYQQPQPFSPNQYGEIPTPSVQENPQIEQPQNLNPQIDSPNNFHDQFSENESTGGPELIDISEHDEGGDDL